MGDQWNALADPTRRMILKMLRRQDLNAGEIACAFDMAKPSVSHHLGILKGAGLVAAEKRGQNVIYSLRTSVMEDLLATLLELTDKEGNTGA